MTTANNIRETAEHTRRLARIILSNDVEYSEEERGRVRDALENDPQILPRVLSELHPAPNKEERVAA